MNSVEWDCFARALAHTHMCRLPLVSFSRIRSFVCHISRIFRNCKLYYVCVYIGSKLHIAARLTLLPFAVATVSGDGGIGFLFDSSIPGIFISSLAHTWGWLAFSPSLSPSLLPKHNSVHTHTHCLRSIPMYAVCTVFFITAYFFFIIWFGLCVSCARLLLASSFQHFNLFKIENFIAEEFSSMFQNLFLSTITLLVYCCCVYGEWNYIGRTGHTQGKGCQGGFQKADSERVCIILEHTIYWICSIRKSLFLFLCHSASPWLCPFLLVYG